MICTNIYLEKYAIRIKFYFIFILYYIYIIRLQPLPPPPELCSMASRRMDTKPVITCLKTLLIIYSFVFWVSGHAGPAAALPSIGQCSDAPGRDGGGKKPKQKSNLGPLLTEIGAGLGLQDGRVQLWGCSDPAPRPV